MCRRELEKQFSQQLEEVEVRFNGDQEAVSKRFEADVHKLEQHYQSEIAALAQQHAADRAHWEEESEAATKEAEQQWKLLREALKMENQCLELSHAQDIKALTDKNLQLQAELEVFVSAARTKEIELSRQLNELHNDRMEAKDLLLAQAENKATELEEMLKQAVDDFIQERAELQWSLSALESRRGEVLSFTESMELKGTIQEGEELLSQELNDERKALLAERDALALRVVQLEGIVLQLTGTTGEPSAKPLGEPCIESTEVFHAESIGDNCEETSKESTVQPFGELNQYTCTESTDEFSPKHLICEEFSVNKDDEEEAGIMDEVTDAGLGDPQQHRCLEIGVTHDITSNYCADELDMSDVESNNSGTETPDCACLIDEKEKTEEKLSNPGVDGSEDAALNEELKNAERNSTESQRDDTLEMAEEDILNGTEIEAQILVENEASYNQESLQHHEFPSTDDTQIENNCRPLEPVIEDNPEVGISISSLENEIRAFANKVCSLTTVDTELDKVADFRDVCIQEILDLQESVMQYSKSAEGTSSQLQSPEWQYLDKENIIHQVPNRFDQMEASIKDVQLAELKICFEQSIQENLQLVERNRNLEKRVKSLEGKMHVVLDLHKQQASVLEKTAQLRVENSKLKVLLQELDKQDIVDSDSSDTSNNSSSNSQLKENIAAVAELEFFCMEFEKQNLQLRRELADLQDKSLRIHEQMQEQRYHVMVPFVLL